MDASKEKLAEAKFFYQQLVSNQNNREQFKYYLTAFLASCRGVIDSLKVDFGKAKGFWSWHNKIHKDNFMFRMKDKRNDAVHERPIQPKGNITASFSDALSIGVSVVSIELVPIDESGNELPISTPSVQHSTETIQTVTPAKDNFVSESSVSYLWYFDDTPNVDVVTLCQQYLTRTEELVQECGILFRKP